METPINMYQEFSTPKEAVGAVRALVAAGLLTVDAFELFHSYHVSDVGSAPPQKTHDYILKGIWRGSLIGLFIGILVFMIPSAFVPAMHPILVVTGIIVCTVVGISFGLGVANVLSKRDSMDPISKTKYGRFGVNVYVENMDDLRRARLILSQFATLETLLPLRDFFHRSATV